MTTQIQWKPSESEKQGWLTITITKLQNYEKTLGFSDNKKTRYEQIGR